jgi:hypothetical protein
MTANDKKISSAIIAWELVVRDFANEMHTTIEIK